jgi:hypothetical protein
MNRQDIFSKFTQKNPNSFSGGSCSDPGGQWRLGQRPITKWIHSVVHGSAGIIIMFSVSICFKEKFIPQILFGRDIAF